LKIFLLHFLDYFFLIFHTVFTLFNLFGWAIKKTRKFHLGTIGLTAFSWFVLGIIYGWGFCFCTEWHWQVRESLEKPILSYSYIHFLIKEITGIDFNPEIIDTLVVILFIICAILSISLNIREPRLVYEYPEYNS